LRRDGDAARLTGMTDRLAAALCRIDGVTESDSAFKDAPGFWVNGKEIAHFEGASAIDLRLTRAEIRPPDGSAPLLPPTGVALARRRRFH
jgi:hypothetical protein